MVPKGLLALPLGMLCCAMLVVSPANPVFGYTPSSPEVKAMIQKGVAFLEAQYGGKPEGHATELGGICVAAMACYKHTNNPQHPVVQAAVAKCREEARKGFDNSAHANYSLGFALIFLGDLDPVTYRPEMEALIAQILKKQTSWGAWTYEGYNTGDTSQTQFALLGLWMAERQGFQVPQQVFEACCNWLLRTQAPDGAFGYQGKDPGVFRRVAQERTTESMGVAGTATLYVCGELLGFIKPAQPQNDDLPPALRRVDNSQDGSAETAVDRAYWEEAIRLGDAWIRAKAGIENHFNSGLFHQYYYMYSVERYWAFRDLAEKSPEKEPAWYNAGVDYLKRHQDANGSWRSTAGAEVDTAFACLYLMRSSQQTVRRIKNESGLLRGGKFLPDDLTQARVDPRGNVVGADTKQPVDDLLAMLEDPNAPQADYLDEVPSTIELSDDPQKRAAQLERVRRLAVNGSFQARLTAVRTLGTVRDLKNVPPLIYALSDPDWRVVKAARDGLRFISRKIDGFGFEVPEGEPPNRNQWKKAQQDWTAWLLSVDPDAPVVMSP